MKVCSIFSQVLKLFSRGEFNKAVKEHKAERHDVHVHVVTQANGTDVARYAALMQHGRYAAAYLGIALGRYGTAVEDSAAGSGNPAEDPAW